MLLFALAGTRGLGERIAASLGIELAPCEEREFEDGEHKARPLVSVRGRDVFVVESLHGDDRRSVNDRLCRLLFFIGALKDADARRVTAVVPYFCYARKDRKTKPRDPVTTRYIAAMFEAVGTDRLVALEVHNLQAFQNAFRCRTEHVTTARLFAEPVRALVEEHEVVVLSPDVGGVRRCNQLRDALEAALGRPVGRGFMEKRRSGGVVSGELLAAEVRDRVVIIYDDMISTGETMVRAALACKAAGAVAVHAVAAHGLFIDGAKALFADPRNAVDSVMVTDSVPPFRVEERLAGQKLRIVGCAPLLGEVVRRLHRGGSIVELLEG
ncbi:MAG: ribose-phosphate pyrophosphokinase [Rhodospirillaceae bacterium]|nr:ribose-phosphate pyrophosphokinase [Rhodospirillaceae bacterium]